MNITEALNEDGNLFFSSSAALKRCDKNNTALLQNYESHSGLSG